MTHYEAARDTARAQQVAREASVLRFSRDQLTDAIAQALAEVRAEQGALPPWTRCDYHGALVPPSGPYVLLADLQATIAQHAPERREP